MILSIIVAATRNNAIGKDNRLLARLSGDLRYFKKITTGHSVIMGRRTFESMGKALPQRRNIVISRNSGKEFPGCERAGSLESAIELVKEEDEVFIIGGGSVYRQAWSMADRLYITRIETELEGDVFIPDVLPEEWEEIWRESHMGDEKNEYSYTFINYRRRNRPDFG